MSFYSLRPYNTLFFVKVYVKGKHMNSKSSHELQTHRCPNGELPDANVCHQQTQKGAAYRLLHEHQSNQHKHMIGGPR